MTIGWIVRFSECYVKPTHFDTLTGSFLRTSIDRRVVAGFSFEEIRRKLYTLNYTACLRVIKLEIY